MRRGPAPEVGISFILPHSLALVLPKRIMKIRDLKLFVRGYTASEYTVRVKTNKPIKLSSEPDQC